MVMRQMPEQSAVERLWWRAMASTRRESGRLARDGLHVPKTPGFTRPGWWL